MNKKPAKRRVTRAKSGAAKDLSAKGRSVRGGRENQVFSSVDAVKNSIGN
jgi:hypothetical protein